MNKTLVAVGLAALTLAAGGVAVAQQSAERPQPRALRADTDGDQRLSQAEFVGRRIDRLAAADTDRDGSVTRDEMRAAGEARRAQRAEARFDRLDADGDGAVSKAEFEARREHRAGERADRGPRRAHRARHGRAGHALSERGPVVIADGREKAEAAFARMDADQDGYVTAAERQTARAGLREQRRERMAERRAARRAQQPSPSAPASE